MSDKRNMQALVEDLLEKGWNLAALERASEITVRTWQRWRKGGSTNSEPVRKRAFRMLQLDPAAYVKQHRTPEPAAK